MGKSHILNKSFKLFLRNKSERLGGIIQVLQPSVLLNDSLPIFKKLCQKNDLALGAHFIVLFIHKHKIHLVFTTFVLPFHLAILEFFFKFHLTVPQFNFFHLALIFNATIHKTSTGH